MTVGNDEAVGSGIAVGLAFVFISTQWCYHENYTFASGFGTETWFDSEATNPYLHDTFRDHQSWSERADI